MIELKPRDGSSDDRDADGVRIVSHGAKAGRGMRVLQGVALLLVASCAGYILMPRQLPSSQAHDPDIARSNAEPSELAAANARSPDAGVAATAAVETPPARSVTPRRMATRRPTEVHGKDPTDTQELSELPIPMDRLKDITAGEYIKALNDAGIHEGIGAFPPPGTSPPLEGLAVPEDYELPEGYVRHFQTTDDGQSIDPILMYSPDYEFLDANGNPVLIPADRVVPAEHAPPGMPVRPIRIPEPREPGDTSR